MKYNCNNPVHKIEIKGEDVLSINLADDWEITEVDFDENKNPINTFSATFVKKKVPTLKPCPFCGGAAHLKKDNYSHLYWVMCENGCVELSNTFKTEEEAIKMWNRRV